MNRTNTAALCLLTKMENVFIFTSTSIRNVCMMKISLYLFLVSFIVAGTPTGTAARAHSHFKRLTVFNLHVGLTFEGKTAAAADAARPTYIRERVRDSQYRLGLKQGRTGAQAKDGWWRTGKEQLHERFSAAQWRYVPSKSTQVITSCWLLTFEHVWAEAQSRAGLEKMSRVPSDVIYSVQFGSWIVLVLPVNKIVELVAKNIVFRSIINFIIKYNLYITWNTCLKLISLL